MITDLNRIAKHARQHQDDYEAFRFYVEICDLSDRELDALVDRLAQPIIDAVDCTQCANCCRSLDVYLTPTDAKMLAEGINMSLEDLETHSIDHQRAQAQDEWGLLQGKPCPFLQGKLCSVYAHRPESCRAYPEFTPDFRWQLGHILGGVGKCPIIYNVIQAVKAELNW